MITKVFCWLGIHQNHLENSDFEVVGYKYFRQYKRCLNCKKWGKPTFFKKVAKVEPNAYDDDGNPIKLGLE